MPADPDGGAFRAMLDAELRQLGSKETANGVSRNALFVCFGCLSNVGTLTGLAGLQVVREVGTDRAGVFCLGGLATEAQSVLDKTRAAERIITVDGCALNCARKIVEGAGFTPDRALTLVQDCGLKKGPPLEYNDADVELVAQAIREALQPAR